MQSIPVGPVVRDCAVNTYRRGGAVNTCSENGAVNICSEGLCSE